jgi:hypothetical protein
VKQKPAPLPTDAKARKDIPVTTGVLDYFPLAIAEVAKVSKAGNDQHNPGQPLHWAREKSTDHANCIGRHLMERGTFDDLDGMRHSAKLAWRALALLQTEMEMAEGYDAAEEARKAKEPVPATSGSAVGLDMAALGHILGERGMPVIDTPYAPPGSVFVMNKSTLKARTLPKF